MRIFGSICQKHPSLNGERYAAKSKNGLTPSGCVRCVADRVANAYRNSAELREAKATYHKVNKVRIAATKRAWRLAHKKEANQRHKAWQIASPEKAKAWRERQAPIHAKWKRDNAALEAGYQAKRRAAQLCATPAWANEFFMEEAYRLAALRTKMLGYPWHVDHIVPLQSKFVCGLHVHNNLRVIPGAENRAKGNQTWPDMPTEV